MFTDDNVYSNTVYNAQKAATLSYYDAAISELTQSIDLESKQKADEAEHCNLLATTQAEIIDNLFEDLEEIAPDDGDGITNWLGSLQTSGSTIGTVATTEQSARSGRNSANTTTLNNLKATLKTEPETAEKVADRLYRNTEQGAWNSYLTGVQSASTAYLTSQKTAENTYKTASDAADTAYRAASVIAYTNYHQAIHTLDTAFYAAVAEASDPTFTTTAYFTTTGVNGNLSYQKTTLANTQSKGGWWESIQNAATWTYEVGSAAVVGVGQGACNVAIGIKDFGKEYGCQVIDCGGGLITAASLCTDDPIVFEPWSQSLQALDHDQISVPQYYGEFGVNVITAGTSSQVKTCVQLYNGAITVDQASQQLGSTGLLQLGSAYGMHQTGGIFTKDISKIFTSNEGVGIILSPRAVRRFTSDPYYRQLIESAGENPISRGKFRTIEMVVGNDGFSYIGRSGHIPGYTQMPTTVNFGNGVTKPICAFPKALIDMENAGTTPHIVIKGGIVVNGDSILYMPPCSRCTDALLDLHKRSTPIHAIPPRTLPEYVPPLLVPQVTPTEEP